ncbi:hypothetical protein RJT34_28664 [Clitoria ternatea]|uniref:Secreted protein n=1 Tax=Clitoria ternatea TaxID=43366 RepID=A0AAN9FEQ4_CLITE
MRALCFLFMKIGIALSYLVMSFAGSGIPASKKRALELIAVYRGICVQVHGLLEDVLTDLSGLALSAGCLSMNLLVKPSFGFSFMCRLRNKT